MVLGMARRGQIRSQVDDTTLKGMLEQIGGAEGGAPKVKMARRMCDDSDSEPDLEGL